MQIDLFFLGVGLVALVAGGDAVVRGATALARRLGVTPVLIGLTVVAFGTSMPELVVNVAAALRGDTAIGFGNVVGSNIANIGLLLAVSAMLAPVAIHRTLVVREIPMMILACAALLVLGGGGILGDAESGYSRGDGLMLLLLFTLFLYYTIGEALYQRDEPLADVLPAGAVQVDPPEEEPTGRLIAILVLGGLGALMLGGEFTVRGATGVATYLGISQSVIGLTVVAIGTSLPELATTIAAARKGQGDLAIGTIVGSNIYNMLFIWGTSVTIAPSVMPEGGVIDILVMTALSLVLLPMVISQDRLSRSEGFFMLLAYVGYIGWLAVR